MVINTRELVVRNTRELVVRNTRKLVVRNTRKLTRSYCLENLVSIQSLGGHPVKRK